MEQKHINVIRTCLKIQRVFGNEKSKSDIEETLKVFNNAITPKPIEEWHEDEGDCLWWKFPIEEAPYCGTPLDVDFPDGLTHYTKVIMPAIL